MQKPLTRPKSMDPLKATSALVALLLNWGCVGQTSEMPASEPTASTNTNHIYLLLKSKATPATPTLVELVMSATARTESMTVCFSGGTDECQPTIGTPPNTQLLYSTDDRRFFRSMIPIVIMNGLTLDLYAVDEKSQVLQSRTVTFALDEGSLILDNASPSAVAETVEASGTSETPTNPAQNPASPGTGAAVAEGTAAPQRASFAAHNADGWFVMGDSLSAANVWVPNYPAGIKEEPQSVLGGSTGGLAHAPQSYASGGADGGGAIKCIDGGHGVTSYFISPTSFGGNRLGQTLHFALRSEPAKGKAPSYYKHYDVLVEGDGIILASNMEIEPPSSGWGRYQIKLSDDEYWQKLLVPPWLAHNGQVEALASVDEINAVFTNITRLAIRCEFMNHAKDVGHLSAVRVE